jgi:Protein of unknown function (DUF4231)
MAQALDGIVLVLSAAIPTAAAMGSSTIVLGILGALITVLTGLSHEHRWKENWVRHVRSRVAIERELVSYKNKGQPYDAIESAEDQRAY